MTTKPTERILSGSEHLWFICWPTKTEPGALVPLESTGALSKERAWERYTDGRAKGEERGYVCRKFYLSLEKPK